MGSHSFLCFVVFLYCCVLIGAGEVCLVVILFILLADRQLCNRSLSFVIVEVYMIGLHFFLFRPSYFYLKSCRLSSIM